MKKNNNLIIIILFACLGVLLVLYFTFNNQNKKRYQWLETYKSTSDQPYGTQFIQKLLENYRPGQKFILNNKKSLQTLLDTTVLKTKTDYVLIGQDIYLNEADKKALLNFIHSGNDAFIATVNLPFDIIDSIFTSECDREIFLVKNDTLAVTLNFYNTKLKTPKGFSYSYRYGKADQNYFWNALNPEIFCDSTQSITPLGYINPNKVNFFRFSFGKGHLYIHSNPLVFTNYFLVKPDKADYASSVFSHLHGESIIWDEFSKSAFSTKNNAPEISPLSYILQHESLRYAWWLMLASAILYTVFAAKRKQRVIPVLEAKANTSLEFVNMISVLHFQSGNPKDIARKKVKYFLYFIKVKYGVHTQSLTEGHLNRLAEKSKVNLADLKLILDEFNHVEHQPYYNQDRLVDLYNALEKFYKHCK
ncbi:MAG TPA: DUF4350 domain-containing protein [Cyclobacteriaceae bacterium]|nr:DUF4350 domain-containing protein [Cyclobacteriaceae bacterium]